MSKEEKISKLFEKAKEQAPANMWGVLDRLQNQTIEILKQ